MGSKKIYGSDHKKNKNIEIKKHKNIRKFRKGTWGSCHFIFQGILVIV